ncbi:MAG TPA: NADH-quinone oxidoreductase subunit L [bacterium]|nr:NADH-quinone oxidoreductase subunit L [bacterium]
MTYVVWIPLLPLLGWVAIGLAGGRWGRRVVAVVACGTVVAAFAVGLALFSSLSALPPGARHVEVDLYRWIAAGPIAVPLRLLVDPLSVVMVLVVSGVGALIHIYSVGYMADDEGFARYFAYLNLFMASMLTLVLAGNLVVMFIGWEGVGLCSYLLIAFWFSRPLAAAAGVKAFLVTRLGDVGFLLGIFLAFGVFGTTDFGVMTRDAASHLPLGGAAATALCLLLFLGAIGKSAQLPLYFWLPDAMEGPTPVSALIHAATMVTAGVFMIVRMHAVYLRAPLAMDVVAVVGAVTAIFAAASALVEPDLKRVLAYSTISQLGYMFLAVGVGAWGAGIFHLTSHAFFKALLFLAAGSVMHALGGTTDMRQMGGLATPLPFTAATFGIGALALAGLPPFTGFFSKDQILSAAFHHGDWILWIVGLVAAGLTAVYIVRAFVLTFLGPARSVAGGAHGAPEPHEAPAVMRIPIEALAVLTILGGALGLSFTQPGALAQFLAPVVGASGTEPVGAGAGSEGMLVSTSIAVALAGVIVSWLIYRTGTLRGRSAVVRAVLAHQFYVEDIFNAVVALPARGLARAFDLFDREGVDGIVMWIGRTVGRGGDGLRRVQSGYLRQYAALVLLGVVILLAYWVSR